jgi:DNA-binding transcriptional LysR family regulator
VELRHLDTLRAISEEGSFTAAAESRNTVQSNVSEQVRQLEQELGVQLVRRGGRKGAALTECGEIVVERARRIGLELDALRADLSMLQELQTGDATFGVVGTASRWLVPSLVADLSRRASGVHLRVTEGASERLAAQVANHEMAQAVVTEPVTDHRLVLEHLLDEELVGIAPESIDVGPEPVPLSRLAELNIVLPPIGNPLRTEVESAAALAHVRLKVPVEIDGVRLIADLVMAGVGAAVLPATALPAAVPGVRRFTLAGVPPRRLALVVARDAHLSLADQAVRASVLRLVAAHNAGTDLA